MIDRLLAVVNTLSHGNAMMAGAISLWGMAVLTYLLREVPNRIRAFIISHATTQMTVELNQSGGNENLAYAFLKWVVPLTSSSWSRNFMAVSPHYDGTNAVLSAGDGLHIFWFNRRLCWFTQSKVDSQGTHIQKRTITVTTFGRSRSVFDRMLDQFGPKDLYNHECVYQWNSGWELTCRINPRPLESIAIPAHKLAQLTTALDKFYADREWYLEKGISHKIGLLLHGVPGCGKTSLIRALAGHYKRNVYALNVTTMTDESFSRALSKVPINSFILVEDFDSAGAAVSKRANVATVPSEAAASPGLACVTPVNPGQESVVTESSIFGIDFGMSMTGMLNALDGIVSLDNNVLFFTTNCIESIDAAVLRKGRCDVTIELGLLQHPEIVSYLSYLYPDHVWDPNVWFAPIAGCDLQALVLEFKRDSNAVVSLVPVLYK